MKLSSKYKHIWYSYPGVPPGWVPIVEKTIIEIKKAMWVQCLPLFIKRLIHYLATDNSCVRIRSRFWYKIRNKLTKGQIITDIKDKYGTLRIYNIFC